MMVEVVYLRENENITGQIMTSMVNENRNQLAMKPTKGLFSHFI